MFILAFLMLHWIDMGTDAYMISFYWYELDHLPQHCDAACSTLFFLLRRRMSSHFFHYISICIVFALLLPTILCLHTGKRTTWHIFLLLQSSTSWPIFLQFFGIFNCLTATSVWRWWPLCWGPYPVTSLWRSCLLRGLAALVMGFSSQRGGETPMRRIRRRSKTSLWYSLPCLKVSLGLGRGFTICNKSMHVDTFCIMYANVWEPARVVDC